MAGAIYYEKQDGLGEDATPTLMQHPESGDLLLATYDGLGGAGSAPAVRGINGERNHAFVGSRIARGVCEEWFAERDDEPGQQRFPGLEAKLHANHLAALPLLVPDLSQVQTTLSRRLPTTAAGVIVRVDSEEVVVDAFWAGDSRGFVITESAGLQQITRDHVRSEDILSQLINDAPLSNMLTADAAVRLASHRVRLPSRAIVMCCTDGVHGYVRTPGELEVVVLGELVEAGDIQEWMTRLRDRVSGYTADDATLAIAVLGFDDFADLRTAMQERANTVTSTQSTALAHADEQDAAAVAAARAEAWAIAKPSYEALLPPPETRRTPPETRRTEP